LCSTIDNPLSALQSTNRTDGADASALLASSTTHAATHRLQRSANRIRPEHIAKPPAGQLRPRPKTAAQTSGANLNVRANFFLTAPVCLDVCFDCSLW
jgi:hypothetical protein